MPFIRIKQLAVCNIYAYNSKNKIKTLKHLKITIKKLDYKTIVGSNKYTEKKFNKTFYYQTENMCIQYFFLSTIKEKGIEKIQIIQLFSEKKSYLITNEVLILTRD